MHVWNVRLTGVFRQSVMVLVSRASIEATVHSVTQIICLKIFKIVFFIRYVLEMTLLSGKEHSH